MSKIIAYTYEADYHCPDCTRHNWRDSIAAAKYVRKPETLHEVLDENGVPFTAIDREGNRVHPIFSTDELPCDLPESAGGYTPVTCGDCRAIIKEASPDTVLSHLRAAAEAAARGASGVGPVPAAAAKALGRILTAARAGLVTWISVPGPNPQCPALQGNGSAEDQPFQLLVIRAPIVEEGGKLCYRGTAIAGPGIMVIHLHHAIAEYLFTVAERSRN